MKRLFVAVIFVIFISLFITGNVFAQETEPIQIANLFSWAGGESPEWSRGALYAILGLIGALVTVFGLVGGAIPGTAGSVRIDAGIKRIEERERLIDRLVNNPDSDAIRLKEIRKATDKLRQNVTNERRRQFAIASVLYAILGAFFATMLAQDMLSALAIGAGWTAYIGAVGLKTNYAERKDLKDEALEDLETTLTEYQNDIKDKLTAANAWDNEYTKDLSEIKEKTSVAKAL